MKSIKNKNKSSNLLFETLSIIFHQLRSSLTAIKWRLEMLLENGKLSKEHKEKIQYIYKSNEQLISSINNLLNLAKAEAGELVVEKQIGNIEKVISDAVEILEPEAGLKNIKVEIKTTKKIKDSLFDYALLLEVFKNLLDNAITYAPPNSVVKIKLDSKGKDYIMAIHNDGPPISTKDRKKIFKKFHRGSIAKQIKPSGSGLGLYIARIIIEAHKGKIWFKSPVHKIRGVTFYVQLPA